MSTIQKQLLASISEKEFQNQVIEAAQLAGWMVHAERPAMTKDGYRTPIQGNAGFPDLVLVNTIKPRLLFAELKRESGVVTPEQEDWIIALGRCGVEVYVWRPSDWDRITDILGGLE